MKKICEIFIDYTDPGLVIRRIPTEHGTKIAIYSTEPAKKKKKKNKKEKKKEVTPQEEQIYKLVHEYLALQKKNWPKRVKVTPSAVEAGYKEIERAIRIDGYKLRDLRSVLLWNASDIHLFWNKNLLTLTTLRKKCSNESTKLQNIFDNYERADIKTSGKETNKEETVRTELPKWQTKVAKKCPCHGTDENKRELTKILYANFEELPGRVKRVFCGRVGGKTDFVLDFWKRLGTNGKVPHCKTLMDLENGFWVQYLSDIYKQLGVLR